MICKKCGAKVYQGSKFCGECGAAIESLQGTVLEDNRQFVNERRTNKKRIAIFGIAISIIVFIVVLFAMNGSDNSTKGEETQSNSEIQDNQDYLNGSSADNKGAIEKKQNTLEISESGFSFEDGYCSCGFIVKNNSDSFFKDVVTYYVTAKDKSGKILETAAEGFAASLNANEETGRAIIIHTGEKPDSIEYEFVYNNASHNDVDDFKVCNVNVSKDNGEIKITGEVINEKRIPYDNAEVYVIFRDKNKKIIGGNKTYIIPKMTEKEKSPFKIEEFSDYAREEFDIYAVGYNY